MIKLLIKHFIRSIAISSICVCSVAQSVYALPPKDYAVLTTAQSQISPPAVILKWEQPYVTISDFTYKIYRKARDASSWGSPIATLAGIQSGYTDSNISAGVAYEYKIDRQVGYINGLGNPTSEHAYSYVYSGVNAEIPDDKGKVILIVDNTFVAALSQDLTLFTQDLAGDGWKVIRHDVSRTSTPAEVKALIQADYNADSTNVKAVILFGHIPIQYSGSMAPDGHTERAWPADAYYGDMDGTWTSSTTYLPSDVELEVGRIDLYDMPAFAPKTEQQLLQQYLAKNHKYRMGKMPYEKVAYIQDDFMYFSGEAFSKYSWMSFPLLCNGAGSIERGFSLKFGLLNKSYLWAHGNGSGTSTSFSTGAGKVDTTDFAANTLKAVFFTTFGSYFGEWSTTNNCLRAPLAMPSYGLTNVWSGRPGWFFHHMGYGEEIGLASKIAQNNSSLYLPINWGAKMVHIALMGDPTLRLYPVNPPSDLYAVADADHIDLTWTASNDNIVGYNIYRAESAGGSFVKLNAQPVTSTDYTDNQTFTSNTNYMVRAVKAEVSASGTYINKSQGIFSDIIAQLPSPTLPVQKFSVGTTTIKDLYGNAVQQLKPNMTVVVNAQISNIAGEDTQVYMIVALYDAQNILKQIVCTDKTVKCVGKFYGRHSSSKYPRMLY